MTKSWQAVYLDGKSAVRHQATVQLTPEHVHIATESGAVRSWPHGQIRQTQGSYAGEHVRLEFGENQVETLVIRDHCVLEALHAVASAHPRRIQHLHRPSMRSARLRWTVMAALVAIGAIAGLYRWGLPLLAATLTPHIPLSWEEQLGQAAVAALAPPEVRCTDQESLNALRRITERLTDAQAPLPYRIQVYLVDRPIVNALAAPGGSIVLFRGLLEKTGSAEELAGVLAHEIQHIAGRHVTTLLIEQTASSLLLAALSGDISGGLAYGLEAAGTMGLLRYSRAFETDADLEGLRNLRNAGINPAGMIRFFETLQRERHEEGDLRSYLSSHPSTETRIQTLQQALQPSDSALAPLLPSVRWDRVRALCRPTPTPPPPTDAGRVNHHNRSVAPPLSSSPRAIAHPPR
jgi:Zn-dependent protease with chaperone function